MRYLLWEVLQIQRRDFNSQTVIADQEQASTTDPLNTEDNLHPPVPSIQAWHA